MEDLKNEIKQLIIDCLKIPDVKPDDIDNNVPLFSPDSVLQLDSIDSLEIIVALQQKYNVRIDDQNLARSILESVNSIAEFVSSKREATQP